MLPPDERALWAVAEASGLVPMPPTPTLLRRLASWWALPHPGCPHAANGPVFARLNSGEVSCSVCGSKRLREQVCDGCGAPTRYGVAGSWVSGGGRLTLVWNWCGRCSREEE